MIRSVPLSLLWVAMTNFAASTAFGLKSDAIRLKGTGDGIVFVNPDDRTADFDLYFVPAAKFSVIFPVGLVKVTTDHVEAIIREAIEASTDMVTVAGALPTYIDAFDRTVGAMLPALLGLDGLGSLPKSGATKPANPDRFPPGKFN